MLPLKNLARKGLTYHNMPKLGQNEDRIGPIPPPVLDHHGMMF